MSHLTADSCPPKSNLTSPSWRTETSELILRWPTRLWQADSAAATAGRRRRWCVTASPDRGRGFPHSRAFFLCLRHSSTRETLLQLGVTTFNPTLRRIQGTSIKDLWRIWSARFDRPPEGSYRPGIRQRRRRSMKKRSPGVATTTTTLVVVISQSVSQLFV